MTICSGELAPISLVPGDTWGEIVQINKQDGTPAILSNWTITLAEVRKRGASSAIVSLAAGTLEIDTAALDEGKIGFAADAADTGVVRALGNRYELEIEGISPEGAVKTLYFGPVIYVEIATTNIITVNHIGFQGAPGRSVLIVETAAELVSGFGVDGDSAVVAETGIVWRKTNGVWATTGVQFIGTLLPDTIAARDKAKQWAEEDEDVEVEPGQYSAKHHASKAATSETNAAGSAGAAAGSAAAALASENAAGVSRDQAGTYAGQALGYKDETSVLRALTEALKASVDQTALQLNTLIGALPDLSGITAAMLGTAVRLLAATDIVAHCWWFSDADEMRAMRRVERGTSWYNEAPSATRGSRKSWAQSKLVVARAGSVTIYDMDNGGAMWMAINQASTGISGGWDASTGGILGHGAYPITSVCAASGQLIVGTARAAGASNGFATGRFVIDFALDGGTGQSGNATYRFAGTISQRSTTTAPQWVAQNSVGIVNAVVNSVAAYVAQGTPVDPIRRLPNPTIAVGTAGGVSVIHPDGRIANSNSTAAYSYVSFGSDGILYSVGAGSSALRFSPPNEYTITNFADRYYQGGAPAMPSIAGTGIAAYGRKIYRGSAAGLAILQHEPGSGVASGTQNNRSSVAYVTRDYSTAWMTGQILMALAESTRDQTSYVDTEIATGGNFDADISGWTQASVPFPGVWDAGGGNGRAKLDGAGNGGNTGLFRDYAVTAGQAYRVSDVIEAIGAIGFVRFYDGAAFSTILASHTTAGTNTSFVVPSTSVIRVYGLASAAQAFYFDSISIKRAVRDRSAAGNHAQVIGTVGRAPVATNAELCWYGGFSTSNYLEVPYSSAFDWGTGDFSMAFPFRITSLAATNILLRRHDGTANPAARWAVQVTSAGTFQFVAGATQVAASSIGAIVVNRTYQCLVERRAGVVYIYLDGVLAGSGNSTDNLTLANAKITIGTGLLGDGSAMATPLVGNIGQVRIGASAPTPAQIRQAYADELAMFQPGAKILLSGSGSVNQPGYDKGTDVLYVPQTTGGTDLFKGLCRVETISIASVNGLGPELAPLPLNFASGWSVVGGGSATDADTFAVSGASGGLQRSLLTIGKVYLVEFSYTKSDATTSFGVYNATGGTTNVVGAAQTAASGTVRGIITAAVVHLYFRLAGTASVDITSLSIREVTTVRITSDNHKAAIADNDNVAIITDQEEYLRPATIGMREALTRKDAERPYDRAVVRWPSAAVTSNATPTVIGYLPMDKGEAGTWYITATAREWGEPAAPELASYDVRVTVARPQEGNIAVSGSPSYSTISETTGTMDVTVAANTTVQALAITATGVAAKNVEWGIDAYFVPSNQQVAA